MIDLDHYCWRERIVIEDVERLFIPHQNPELYEQPADGLFASAEEAQAWRAEFIKTLEEANCDDLPDHVDHGARAFLEAEAMKDWVLVHYVGTIEP